MGSQGGLQKANGPTIGQVAGPLQPQQGVPRDLDMEALRLSLDRCLKFTGETCVENRVGKEASWPSGLIEH